MGGETSLKDYKKAFENFNEYIKEIHTDIFARSENHTGYFINYVKYQKFENEINNSIKDSKTQTIKIDDSKKLKTESLDVVINSISNDYKYIIINSQLQKLICKEDDPDKEKNKFEYQIFSESPEYFLINPNSNKSYKFKYNENNIIDKSSIIIENEIRDINKANKSIVTDSKILDQWYNIHRDTTNYYLMEKEICEKLNQSESHPYQGFLVDNEWVDRWKKYSYYEKMKINFLQNPNKNENLIQQFINKEQLESKYNYNDIKDVEKYIV